MPRPLGCDDDRMSGLWNARADVTRLSKNLWITSVAAIGAWGEPADRGNVPTFFRMEIGERPVWNM